MRSVVMYLKLPLWFLIYIIILINIEARGHAILYM